MDVTCGEWSPVQPATTDIQLLCNEVGGIFLNFVFTIYSLVTFFCCCCHSQIRPIVQAMFSTVFAEFTAIEYRELVVRGVHILIKVEFDTMFEQCM